jgi:UV excision repair protein RAD23
MKIKVKTVKGEQYEIDVEGTDKVSAVKESIESTHKLGAAASMKLIYAGKILADEQSVAECNVSENAFLVLMIVKPKAAAPPKETPAAPTPAPATPAPSAAPATPAAPAPAAPRPAMLGGPSEETIKQLTDMGFERSQALAALEAAFGNAERAVEYLMGGLPDNLGLEQAMDGDGDGDGDDGEEGDDDGDDGERGPAPLFNLQNLLNQGGAGDAQPAAGRGDSALGGLRAHPQFMQMVALIQANPALLQPLLQEIGNNNPQILQLINDHQEEFMQILQQPVPAGGYGGGGGGGGGGQNVIQVTPEEREAIGRLEALGFARERVLEAYIACDKNEEFAANYLFDHGNDED